MTQPTNARSPRQPPIDTEANALASRERWTQWQDRGARHDARIGRNLRLAAATVLTLGSVWASVALV